MHVCGVAGQQDPSVAVGRAVGVPRLAGGGDPFQCGSASSAEASNRGRGRGTEPALIVRRLPGEGTRANGELGTLGVVKTGRTVLRAERVDRRRRRRGARVDVDVELVEGLL